MTVSEFDKAIKPNMKGAFLFYGDEEYLKQRYREKVRATLLTEEAFDPFNHAVITELSRLADEVGTLPMMAERRLVEVVDVNLNKLNKDSAEELCELLKNIEDTVVIFYTREEEFNPGTEKKPSEIFKRLSPSVEMVGFLKQAPNRLAAWMGKHFAANGTFAPPDVCHAMIERCGTDMNVLANEIAKLSAYALAHGENKVTREMIPKVVTSYRESGAFDFVNAIMEGKTTRAFALFTDMQRRREKPVEICASITRVVCELFTVKYLTEAGVPAATIAQDLKMKEYGVKLRQNATRNRTVEQLEKAVALCYDTDIKLKSRSIDKYFLIERLIIQLAEVG